MLPKYYVLIDEVPYTPNGKLNKQALLDMEVATTMQEEAIPPSNSYEEELINIWSEILEQNVQGVNLNFFEIGGQSITMIKMLNAVQSEWDTQVSVELFLHDPTIQSLALHIENQMSIRNMTSDESQKSIII